MKLINDRVLEPKLVAFELRHRPDVSDHIHGTAFTSSIGTAGQGPANVFSQGEFYVPTPAVDIRWEQPASGVNLSAPAKPTAPSQMS
jgi:hypothetical protein